ncbi:MAG: hypothetical protein U9Q81_21315 [Pseudomonadota bacterium]|nr:hypothetical protein [Pseudomonadota bacterium]
MRVQLVYGLLIALTPAVSGAQSVLDGLKEGAAEATSAVGETARSAGTAAEKAVGKATTAVDETVESTEESLRDEATPGETRAKLDAMAENTLARLFEEHPESRSLFDQSAGYAVFDAREASFYVAAGYGRGVAVNRETQARTYMKMATAGAGLSFGFGGFERQLVILFEGAADLNRFVSQGLDATAEVGTMTGEKKDQLALRFNEGKAMFVLTKKGWKIAAKLTGSRYWPDDELNLP